MDELGVSFLAAHKLYKLPKETIAFLVELQKKCN
jgi:hypothetical protein